MGPPQPFGMGVPMMPPPLMMGMAPMPIPYITAPVLSTPAPIVVPAPPLKQPLCTEPNNTIRVSNLKEKVSIEDLKKELTKIFSQYGNILDIVAQKGLRLKGQAFIIYEDIASAEKAVAEANGLAVFNRVMVVQFSHNRSDKIAEREGELEANKRERHERFLKRMENRQTRAPKPKNRNASGSSHRPIPDHMLLNKILFLQHLPEEIEEQSLVLLFKQYPGFKEVRLVPGRSDIAFVEYDTEHQASMAKTTLNNYPVLPDHPMKITFAKR
ncbi:hypothetical protein DSO57_1030199 [Entomophthora muscae]|uniref:Uncharacterized protein n=1 Tax=Entomophthora muscae TaxID=34485 RepID=A0ACC2RFQ5_9FUNG|nr:hypothetical protein DSO57_1030199 [Entomophthora muscae]